MPSVIAVDAGTTGVRALAVDGSGAVVDVAYRELTQHFPHPGWVEHDAAEIWDHVAATVTEVADRQAAGGGPIVAVGITNQRETVVAWDRRTGTPRHRALVWQDRRTAETCDRMRDEGHLPLVRGRTGLVLDPYFSATKMAWLLEHGGVACDDDLVLGTVDSWVAWNLTGGPEGGVLATDATNASRTSLYDITERSWSPELCDLFGVPRHALPEVVPSCGRIGTVTGLGALHGIPVSGIAGDQQAALFGQACLSPGMAKVTYGTGSFVLLNIGATVPPPAEGLLTTVAWDLGAHGGAEPFAYALEGAVFVTGAAIQWLRDGLGLIDAAADIGPLAESVASSEGVTVVPAFTGMGSPWWDPYARGTITGLSRGLGRAHIARAVVEAMALQVRDVVDAMREAAPGGETEALNTLRVDGGASVMGLLLQLQADQIRVPVCRPATTETTALGAAMLAGLAEGLWPSLDEVSSVWHLDARFEPKASQGAAAGAHRAWLDALARSRHWADTGHAAAQ